MELIRQTLILCMQTQSGIHTDTMTHMAQCGIALFCFEHRYQAYEP